MRMYRVGFSFGALALVAGLVAPAFAEGINSCPVAVDSLSVAAPAPVFRSSGNCSAWTHTLYFSSADHTTSVGSCFITCRQYDLGSADPTFTGGGTCSGMSSDFPVDNFTPCPCPF